MHTGITRIYSALYPLSIPNRVYTDSCSSHCTIVHVPQVRKHTNTYLCCKHILMFYVPSCIILIYNESYNHISKLCWYSTFCLSLMQKWSHNHLTFLLLYRLRCFSVSMMITHYGKWPGTTFGWIWYLWGNMRYIYINRHTIFLDSLFAPKLIDGIPKYCLKPIESLC